MQRTAARAALASFPTRRSSDLHDEIAEPGVGAHELGADDDEEREAEAHAERHDDPRQRGGDDHAPDQLATARAQAGRDRKSTRLNSSHGSISYAVFCLKKKKTP